MDKPWVFARSVVIVIVVGLLIMYVALAMASDRPFLDAIDGTGLTITLIVGMIVIVVVWGTVRPPAHARREFRDATPGVGKLVEAHSTGRSVNDQPEVELVIDVTTEDGRSFRGSTKAVVDVVALAELTAGVALPVLYLTDERIALSPGSRPIGQ